jgi:hypothetical protein
MKVRPSGRTLAALRVKETTMPKVSKQNAEHDDYGFTRRG